MAINTFDATFRTQFNDEFKVDFERESSWLKQTVRTDGLPGAETIKWDVIDLTDEATQRQRDGKIPVSQVPYSSVSKAPVEHYKKYQIDSFDAFRGNPNVQRAMRQKAIAAVNRSIDAEIVTELDTGSEQLNSGSAVDFSVLGTFLEWTTSLWDNDVPNDGRVWGVITPSAYSQMMRIEEFKSSDYGSVQPANGTTNSTKRYRDWLDVKWVTCTALTGHKSATAKCYIYHESALGHNDDGNPMLHPYWDEAEDQYACWARVRHCAKLILPRGVIRAVHDDTAAFSA